jgi:hypothetical protein
MNRVAAERDIQIFGLKWGDIDFERGTMSVIRSIVYGVVPGSHPKTARWMAPSFFGHFKDVPGIARKVQARNDDIRIGGDAQHVLSGSLGTCSRNLRVHIFRRQSTRAGITLSEVERFAPLRTAQASLNGITHQFLRCDLFFRSRLLDLFDQLARKPYVFGRHTAILLLLEEKITFLTIVNVFNKSTCDGGDEHRPEIRHRPLRRPRLMLTATQHLVHHRLRLLFMERVSWADGGRYRWSRRPHANADQQANTVCLP